MKEEIEEILGINGAMGVNAIAQAIDKPVSTVHKFLERDGYFIKTKNRKWDLPGRLLESFDGKAQELAVRDVGLTIENAVLILETTKNKLHSLITVIDKINRLPSVAEIEPPKVNSQLLSYSEKTDEMRKIIYKNLNKVPDQYKDLLGNIDYFKLTWNEGAKLIRTEILPELTSLILGEITELRESTVQLLQAYPYRRQAGQKKSPESGMSSVSDTETEPHEDA